MRPPAADTIFALSTARGPAGLAVIRISGPGAGPAAGAVAGTLPPPRGLRLARIRDPASGETIDRGLVLWFAGPASVTGEDVAELHVHGGPAVVAALLTALGAQPGCRLAEPGEFTRRGFENGKLDLSAAEGIADLVAAETAAQRRQALRQAGGGFARQTAAWAARLTRALAHAEAAIDFAEEEIPEGLQDSGPAAAAALAAELRACLADGRRGEILRDGLSVAIIGPPNSGKSSLLNALAGREAAIVSAAAGTTRDVIEIRLDLAGYPVLLADTAGLRESAEAIEAEGMRRARARAAGADLTLLVLDAAADAPSAAEAGEGWEGDAPADLDPARMIRVWNKTDLAAPPGPGLAVSALTGAGLADLVAALTAAAERLAGGEPALVTRQRHRAALLACAEALERAVKGSETALVAEDLRLALRALGRITGRVDIEDLLDIVFREFCIGK